MDAVPTAKRGIFWAGATGPVYARPTDGQRWQGPRVHFLHPSGEDGCKPQVPGAPPCASVRAGPHRPLTSNPWGPTQCLTVLLSECSRNRSAPHPSASHGVGGMIGHELQDGCRERLPYAPCGRSSVGRASASQAVGRGFESLRPLP